jgi:pimeloyl-ACP methyl ester carboxylesterase
MNAPVRRSLSLPYGAVSYLEWNGPEHAPLLVFSHANGFNASTYTSLLRPLSNRFRIVAWDMRGHGLSTLPIAGKRPRGWQLFRDDLLRFLDGLDARPTVLAGHSLGASASLLAAATRPYVAQSLVLIEPVMAPDSEAWRARFARLFGRTEQTMPLVAMALKRRAQFRSRETALRGFKGRGAFRTWPAETIADYVEAGLLPEGDGFRLACSPQWEAASYADYPLHLGRLGSRIRVPVAVLCGTMGSSTSPRVLEEFARRHRDTRIVKVDGATHFLPMERPEIVRAEIERAANLPPSPDN